MLPFSPSISFSRVDASSLQDPRGHEVTQALPERREQQEEVFDLHFTLTSDILRSSQEPETQMMEDSRSTESPPIAFLARDDSHDTPKIHPLAFIDRSSMPDWNGQTLTEGLLEEYQRWNTQEDQRLQRLEGIVLPLSLARIQRLREMLSREATNLLDQYRREVRRYDASGSSGPTWQHGLLPFGLRFGTNVIPGEEDEEDIPYVPLEPNVDPNQVVHEGNDNEHEHENDEDEDEDEDDDDDEDEEDDDDDGGVDENEEDPDDNDGNSRDVIPLLRIIGPSNSYHRM